MYNYNDETIPLLIRLPEMIGYYKVFKNGKKVYFTSDDEELLRKFEEIFEDVSNKIGNKFFTEFFFENECGKNIKPK